MSEPSQHMAQLAPFHQPWTDFDAGFLDDEGNVLQHCEIEFLYSILETLAGETPELDDNPSGSDANRTIDLINAAFDEIYRLQGHADLYPGVDVQRYFIRSIHDLSIAKGLGFCVNRLITDAETWKSLGAVIGIPDLYDKIQKAAPVHLWEKFLHPGCPGTGLEVTAMTRIIPPAGTRLLAYWHKKTTQLENKMRALPVNLIQTPPTNPTQSVVDRALEVIGRNNSRYHYDIVTYNPNPFYQNCWNVAIPGADMELELASEYVDGHKRGRVYQPSPFLMKCIHIVPR